jgi:acetylornithine/succinyldiaminopimelate/putrescine aminotransferase
MLSDRALFLRHLAQTSENPLLLEIIRAEGIYLYSSDGKTYIDLISGISVSNLGHCHPAVTNAVIEQVQKYSHLMVYGELIQAPQVRLSELLCSILPKNLQAVYLVNSGSEAIEGALKLSKRFTHRQRIISCKNAYHGSTHGALSIMGSEFFKTAYRPLLPECYSIEYGNLTDIDTIDNNTACVVIEPIQAEVGVRIADKNYFKQLRKKCDEVGALLIFDEVQTAFGRTGKMFAFEHFDVFPDILVLAKALGGGMPIGAFIASAEIMKTLSTNPYLGHITTFGGHPVSANAAIANISTIINTNLIESVESKSKLFLELLLHIKIVQIRAVGLLISIELANNEDVKKVIDYAIESGLLIDWFLFADNCIRIAPPLIITKEQIKISCEILINCLNKI